MKFDETSNDFCIFAVSLIVETSKKHEPLIANMKKLQKTMRSLKHLKIFVGLFAPNELWDPGVPLRSAGKSTENQDYTVFP